MYYVEGSHNWVVFRAKWQEIKREKISRPPKCWEQGPICPGLGQGCVSQHFRILFPGHGWSFMVGARPGEKREWSRADLTLSSRPQAQSSLCHFCPAQGAVPRVTLFIIKLRSRRENQSAHRCAAHSSSSDFCPQSACFCFLSSVWGYRLFCAVLSSRMSSAGGWLTMDLLHLGGSRMMCSFFFFKKKGKEESESKQQVDFL